MRVLSTDENTGSVHITNSKRSLGFLTINFFVTKIPENVGFATRSLFDGKVIAFRGHSNDQSPILL